MEYIKNKTLIITGASQGIGEATAEQIIELREKDGKYESFDDFYKRNKFTNFKIFTLV